MSFRRNLLPEPAEVPLSRHFALQPMRTGFQVVKEPNDGQCERSKACSRWANAAP